MLTGRPVAALNCLNVRRRRVIRLGRRLPLKSYGIADMKHLFETITGFIVLAAAGFFLWYSYDRGHIGGFNDDGYNVSASFGEIGSISAGADVRVGGVKVGTVTGVALDESSYRPVINMQLRNDITLPDDSSAAIVSDGLLGGKYLAVTPGMSDDVITPGGSIEFTQDAVSLEALIGKFAFGGLGGDDKEKESAASDPFAEDSSEDAEPSPFN